MCNLLYIDDDKMQSEIMAVKLEQLGNNISFASTSEEAKALIESSTKFDAIILDIMMRRFSLVPEPGETETGHILYRLIREADPNIPILVVSALRHPQGPARMLGDSRLKWLSKPVDAHHLQEQLAKLLEESKAEESSK